MKEHPQTTAHGVVLADSTTQTTSLGKTITCIVMGVYGRSDAFDGLSCIFEGNMHVNSGDTISVTGIATSANVFLIRNYDRIEA